MDKKAIDVLKEIRGGKIHRLYLLISPEGDYLKNNIVTALKENLIDKETEAFDFTTMYGKNTTANELSHSISTPPFGKAKLIVVKDAEQIKKSDIKKIMAFEIPDFSTLVMIFNSDTKLSPKEKNSTIVNSYSITQTMLKAWIRRKAKENGKKITNDAISELIERVDSDLYLISSEIKKLSLFVGDSKEITREDVMAVVDYTPEIKIFDLIDAIIAEKRTKALKLLKEFLNSEESSPEQLLSLLIKTFMQMAFIKELSERGFSKKEIIETGKIYPQFIINKLLPLTDKARYNDIINKFNALTELDVKSKKGEIELPLQLRLFVEKI